MRDRSSIFQTSEIVKTKKGKQVVGRINKHAEGGGLALTLLPLGG